MRIALCLKGCIGGKRKFEYDDISIAKKSFDSWKKNLLDINENIDVFFHCWNTDYEKEIVDWYKPKKYLCEKKDLSIKTRRYLLKSARCSDNKSIKLMRSYELDNNINYDVVILSRFDVSIFKKINFNKEKLSLSDTLYHNATTPIHKYKKPICKKGCCDINSPKYEIGDLFFISNSKNMYNFITGIWDNIDEYLNHMSGHIFSYKHALKLKLKLDGSLLYTKQYNIWKDVNDGNITLTRWIV